MAIQLYCGRPGSGKSYGVVENVIVPALKMGRLIYTNIPLNIEAVNDDYPESAANVTQFQNGDVTGEWLMSIPGGALVIIDECWRYWPGGMKANELDLKVKEFFAEHRHKSGQDGLTQEIALITQTPSQIAKVIRDLVDQSVLTTKNTGAGSSTTFNVGIYPGCIPSIDKPGEANQKGFGRYKPEIYKYYKSHTKSETGLPGIEIRADKRGSIWNHWYIRYVAPIILLGSIWGAYYTYSFFTGEKFKTVAPAVSQPVPVQPMSATPAVLVSGVILPVPLSPVESTTMRIGGFIEVKGVKTIYVKHADKPNLIKLTMHECKETPNGLECQYKNEIVTANTGRHGDIPRTAPTLTESIVPKV